MTTVLPSAPVAPPRIPLIAGPAGVVELAVPEQVRLDAEQRLVSEVNCLHCGYVLRGLRPEDACPECGTAVAMSLRGDLLMFASPAWLGAVLNGFKWLLASVVATVAYTVLYPFVVIVFSFGNGFSGGAGSMFEWLRLYAIVAVVPAAVSLIAVWRIATPDPRQGATSPAAQRWARVGEVGAFAAVVAAALFTALISSGVGGILGGAIAGAEEAFAEAALSLVADVTNLVSAVALLFWLGLLAARLPHKGMTAQFRVAGWCMLVVGGVLAVTSVTQQAVSYVAMSGFAAGAATAATTTPAAVAALPPVQVPAADPSAPPESTTTLPDGTIRTVYQPGAVNSPNAGDVAVEDELPDGSVRTYWVSAIPGGTTMTFDRVEQPDGTTTTTNTTRDAQGNVVSQNASTTNVGAYTQSPAFIAMTVLQFARFFLYVGLFGLWVWAIVLFVLFFLKLKLARELAGRDLPGPQLAVAPAMPGSGA